MHVGFRSLEMEARKNDVGDCVGKSFAYTTCRPDGTIFEVVTNVHLKKSPSMREPNAGPSDELIYDAATSCWPENSVSEIPLHREKHIRWLLWCADISSRYLSRASLVKIIGFVSRCRLKSV